MTVIAFKEGKMAADSLCTDTEDTKMYNVKKIYRLTSGGLLGTAGDDDCREIVELMDSVSSEEHLPEKETIAETKIDFLGMLALPDGTIWYIMNEMVAYSNSDEWNGFIGEVTEDMYVCGSGGLLALGAMEAGADVEEAVEIAIKRNAACGGEIQIDEIPDWLEKRIELGKSFGKPKKPKKRKHKNAKR